MISFTDNLETVMKGTDIIFLCVNTSENQETCECDSNQIYSAIKSISEMSNNIGNKFFILSVRSTVPVGTHQKIKEFMLKINPNLKYLQCLNPEFSVF